MSNKGTHYGKLEKQLKNFWYKKLLKSLVTILCKYF